MCPLFSLSKNAHLVLIIFVVVAVVKDEPVVQVEGAERQRHHVREILSKVLLQRGGGVGEEAVSVLANLQPTRAANSSQTSKGGSRTPSTTQTAWRRGWVWKRVVAAETLQEVQGFRGGSVNL